MCSYVNHLFSVKHFVSFLFFPFLCFSMYKVHAYLMHRCFRCLQVYANLLSPASDRVKRETTQTVLPAWLENIVQKNRKRSKAQVLAFLENIGIQFIRERNARNTTNTSAQSKKRKWQTLAKTNDRSLSNPRTDMPEVLKATTRVEKPLVQVVSTEMPLLTVTRGAVSGIERRRTTPFPGLQTNQAEPTVDESKTRSNETKQGQITGKNLVESETGKVESTSPTTNAENKVNLHSTELPMVIQTKVSTTTDIASESEDMKTTISPEMLSLTPEKSKPRNFGRKIKSIFMR